jgi:hypothetical protein
MTTNQHIKPADNQHLGQNLTISTPNGPEMGPNANLTGRSRMVNPGDERYRAPRRLLASAPEIIPGEVVADAMKTRAWERTRGRNRIKRPRTRPGARDGQ